MVLKKVFLAKKGSWGGGRIGGGVLVTECIFIY